MNNPKQHSFPTSHSEASYTSLAKSIRNEEGFAKIIAGGRIVRPDPQKPEIERMVTGDQIHNKTKSLSLSRNNFSYFW